MSWLFSRVLVEEYLGASCSDGEPSALSSGSPTQQAFLPPDRMTDFSRLSRFGMTFRPLTADLGEGLLTSFREASRARTSVLQARAQASVASALACGPTWRASLARFDPDSCLWRTAQLSLLEGSASSLVIWPRSGMTVDGQCWELPMLERATSATDSGLWPTPTCPNGGRSVAHVTDWRSPRTAYSASGKKVQVDLAQAVKRWATPVADDTGHRAAKYAQGGTALSTQIGGELNPTWVEWLMGWPLGWTDLKPSATAKSPCAQPLPGTCSPEQTHESADFHTTIRG